MTPPNKITQEITSMDNTFSVQATEINILYYSLCCNLFSGGRFTFSFHDDRYHLSPKGHSTLLAAGVFFIPSMIVNFIKQAALTAFGAVSLFRFKESCFS